MGDIHGPIITRAGTRVHLSNNCPFIHGRGGIAAGLSRRDMKRWSEGLGPTARALHLSSKALKGVLRCLSEWALDFHTTLQRENRCEGSTGTASQYLVKTQVFGTAPCQNQPQTLVVTRFSALFPIPRPTKNPSPMIQKMSVASCLLRAFVTEVHTNPRTRRTHVHADTTLEQPGVHRL